MEDIQSASKAAAEAWYKAASGLDSSIRGLQRQYFECGVRCTSDERRSNDEVAECIQRCQEPMERATSLVKAAGETYQARIHRCHETAGEAVSGDVHGDPSPEQLRQYAAKLKPCLSEQVGKLPELLKKTTDQMPSLDGASGGAAGGAKKGWFGK
jgi:hypothetical protein